MISLEELLDFDFVEDVQSQWDNYMEEGYSIEEATSQILEQYQEILEDEEVMLLYITLGIIQLDGEDIDSRIKEEITEIVENKSIEEYTRKNKNLKKVLQILNKKCK